MPTLTIQVPDNLYAELIRAVAERDIPMQEFLHLAIAEEIDRKKTASKPNNATRNMFAPAR